MSSAMRPPPGMVIGLAAEPLGEPQRVGDAVALLLGELNAARRLDVRARSRGRAAGRPGAWRSARGRRAAGPR